MPKNYGVARIAVLTCLSIDTNTLKFFYSFDYLYKLIKKRWSKFICIYDVLLYLSVAKHGFTA